MQCRLSGVLRPLRAHKPSGQAPSLGFLILDSCVRSADRAVIIGQKGKPPHCRNQDFARG